MQKFERITDIYTRLQSRLVRYIAMRINDEEAAHDLSQDLFVKLLETPPVFFTKTAEEVIVFRMAKNLVNDYLRHHYVRQEADSYFLQTSPLSSNSVECEVFANDIAKLEQLTIAKLPPQRRTVYMMRRFDGLASGEIAVKLGLSKRTVENHLLTGTHQIRESLRACI